MVDSWIHVLARFSPEALLFEALAVGILLASYIAFWILKKRRYGAAGEAIPAGVVRTYLNELIGDADHLRTQLFGLFRQGGVYTGGHEPSLSASALLGAVNNAGAGSAEQARLIESLTTEKVKLETEINELKSASAAIPSGGGGDNAALAELQSKIASLEAKLAEYSVIEDDLANLKRLQQENAKLRAALEGKGGNVTDTLTGGAPAVTAAAASSVVAAISADDPLAALGEMGGVGEAAANPVDDLNLEAALGGDLAASAPAEPTAGTDAGEDPFAALGLGDNPPAEAAPAVDPLADLAGDLGAAAAPAPDLTADLLAEADQAAAPAAPANDASFDLLAGSVDQSLQPGAGATSVDPAAADPLAALGGGGAPAAADLPPQVEEKSDADLVAEFEKMLNG